MTSKNQLIVKCSTTGLGTIFKARKVETNLKSNPLHVHLQFTTYRTYDELHFRFALL